ASWQVWAKAKDDDLKARQEQLKNDLRGLLGAKTNLETKRSELEATRLSVPPGEQKNLDEELRTLQKNLDKVLSDLRDKEFESDVGELERRLRYYESRPWEKLEPRPDRNPVAVLVDLQERQKKGK